ncbi:hypothetical protein WMO24_02385 [Ruthenibacterium sp. CLA-JM-H11]|uniref:Uncharacterized protein n=1 Tax=Ruthenibacterium intestinale TaxID=3133163 RepID=A0ABV1GBT5_9FIRM
MSAEAAFFGAELFFAAVFFVPALFLAAGFFFSTGAVSGALLSFFSVGTVFGVSSAGLGVWDFFLGAAAFTLFSEDAAVFSATFSFFSSGVFFFMAGAAFLGADVSFTAGVTTSSAAVCIFLGSAFFRAITNLPFACIFREMPPPFWKRSPSGILPGYLYCQENGSTSAGKLQLYAKLESCRFLPFTVFSGFSAKPASSLCA